MKRRCAGRDQYVVGSGSPRSGLVQLSVERIAGPTRGRQFGSCGLASHRSPWRQAWPSRVSFTNDLQFHCKPPVQTTLTFLVMKTHRFIIGLTVLNLFILMSALFRAKSAGTPDLPPLLRVRGLELVDDRGRVRATLKVFPADPKVKM